MQHFTEHVVEYGHFRTAAAEECLAAKTFQQGGASSYISHAVQQILRCYFTEEHTISRAFPIRWPIHSLDLIFVIFGFGAVSNLKFTKETSQIRLT